MRKFLLPVDGSESSRCAARHIAERVLDGEALELHLLNVQVRRHVYPGLRNVVSQAKIDEYAQSQADIAIGLVIPILDELGIRYSTHIGFGNVEFGIADHVQRLACEHVVMGTRGLSALAGFALGSIATRVITLVDVPVTLVTSPDARSGSLSVVARASGVAIAARAPTRAPRITLVPVDGSENSDRAIDYVLGESQAGVKREIILLNVQTPYPTGRGWDEITPTILAEAYQDEGNFALRSARHRLEQAGVAHRLEIAIGAAGETIAKYAQDMACDNVIMGTRGLGAGGNFFLGSVAVKVVRLAGVPVTLVR